MDDGVLSWRRWLALGAAFALLFVVMAGIAFSSAPSSARPVALTPARYPTLAPALQVGDRVYVRGPYAARDASSSAAPVVCQLDPTKIGVVIELGASVASTRLDWGKVSIGGCTGWIALADLGKAIK